MKNKVLSIEFWEPGRLMLSTKDYSIKYFIEEKNSISWGNTGWGRQTTHCGLPLKMLGWSALAGEVFSQMATALNAYEKTLNNIEYSRCAREVLKAKDDSNKLCKKLNEQLITFNRLNMHMLHKMCMADPMDRLPPQLKGLPLTEIPVRTCGVYFLVKSNKVIYVGQASDIVNRIREHRFQKPKLEKQMIKREFDRAFFYSLPRGEAKKDEMKWCRILQDTLVNEKLYLGNPDAEGTPWIVTA